MKETKKIAAMLLALMLAVSLGALALAEGENDTTAATAAADALKQAEENSQALTDALTAYNNAKQESRKQARLASLKEELDGYVAAGSLTQEQADLLLNYFAEQIAQGNGQTGGRGNRGGKGMKNGQNGMNNQNVPQNGMNGMNGQTLPQNGMNGQKGFGRGGRHGNGMNFQAPIAPQANNGVNTPDTNTSAAPSGTGV